MLRKASARVAGLGVTRARLAVESELGWLFREQSTEDYGIDAQVEVVDGETVRGKFLAVQIKSGVSLFREQGPDGWWFRPDARHVRSWTNHSLPVVVILYHPETNRCHWQLVNAKTLVLTARGGWKLLVPAAHVLDKSACMPLREAAEGDSVVVRIREPVHWPDEFNKEFSAREGDGGNLSGLPLRQTPITEVDITPSPRLLKALTDLIAAPWVCVAEMVDTAYGLLHDSGAESQNSRLTSRSPR